MWNAMIVWGRCCCVKSTFSPAFPNLFLKQKVYTTSPTSPGKGGWQDFVVIFTETIGYV
jgi:hypothetical protein